ncbi:hypothetical protein P376_5934 [Streptomyces sp. HCCB10043]|nr:hypothetical protein P376_5934 [Streptomyces sp. HCCB10043]
MQPVGDGEPRARLQLQRLGGDDGQRDLYGPGAVGGRGRLALGDPYPVAVEGGEVGEVRFAAPGRRALEAPRQRVRPRTLQLLHGHGQPVEGVAGCFADGLVGLRALFVVHRRGHDESGGRGGPVGERVAQGRVPDGTYERGERGQYGGGQQDGEDGRREQQTMSPHPQKDETRHLIPQPRKHRMRTPPDVHVMLSEGPGFR